VMELASGNLGKNIRRGGQGIMMRNHSVYVQDAILNSRYSICPLVTGKGCRVGHESSNQAQLFAHLVLDERHRQAGIAQIVVDGEGAAFHNRAQQIAALLP
jgi:hypothetical protein